MAFPFLQVGMAVLGGMGKASAAKYEANVKAWESKMEATQSEIDRTIGKAQAAQIMRDRTAQFNQESEANELLFGSFSGESMSQKAYQEAQKDIVGEDLRRLGTQAGLEASARTIQSAMATQRGASAIRAGKYKAMSAIISTGYDVARIAGA